MRPSRPVFGVFFRRLEGARPSKVKFVYRTIISQHSTFGHVIISRTAHDPRASRDGPGRSRPMNLGFFTMPIHPARQGLAAVVAGRPRGLSAGRRAWLHRGLCRRTRHRQGREHHLLHCVPGLDRRRHQANQARHRHDQHAEHPSRHRRRVHRDARPHAGRPPDLRNKPRRTAVGRRVVRQSRRRSQRDVPGGDQPGAGDLGERAALQHSRASTGTSRRKRP